MDNADLANSLRPFVADPQERLLEAIVKKLDWLGRNIHTEPHSVFWKRELVELTGEIETAMRQIKARKLAEESERKARQAG